MFYNCSAALLCCSWTFWWKWKVTDTQHTHNNYVYIVLLGKTKKEKKTLRVRLLLSAIVMGTGDRKVFRLRSCIFLERIMLVLGWVMVALLGKDVHYGVWFHTWHSFLKIIGNVGKFRSFLVFHSWSHFWELVHSFSVFHIGCHSWGLCAMLGGFVVYNFARGLIFGNCVQCWEKNVFWIFGFCQILTHIMQMLGISRFCVFRILTLDYNVG